MADTKHTAEMSPPQTGLSINRAADNSLLVALQGAWTIEAELPGLEGLRSALAAGSPPARLTFDASELTEWDSGLLTLLLKINEECTQNQIRVDKSGLPSGVQRLLDLATAVPERKGARRETKRESFLARIGKRAIEQQGTMTETLSFIGELCLSIGRLLLGKARFRSSELWLFVQETGAQALPIVTLISILVGLILAFIGAVQLAMFGAQIYVANLVGLGMAREMGAMMTGIIMAGRTGASFAAQLGTMQVNEEIDALKTLGISPMDFLVLPRMIALTLMMPLLCIYADLMGILGGALVGIGMFDITPTQYFHQTMEAVPLVHFWIGIFKSTIYGIIVALAGCHRGMQCGRSASAVGEATTSAVVTAIVWIIVWCSITTIMFHVIGI